jgi:hypothetical protein
MAFFSRIFKLTQPALLQFKWFVWLYTKVMYYKNRIHAYLAHWQAYQLVKQRIHAMIVNVKTLFKNNFN